jgi:3-dehydroquinate dehydratase-1
MLCLSLSEKSPLELYKKINEFNDIADLFEIRLDYLEETDIKELKKLKKITSKPFIFTNRKKEEGGRFKGTEAQRTDILLKALDVSPEYIDIELDTTEDLRDNIIKIAKNKGIKVIVSFHDFEKTPSFTDLEEKLIKINFSQCDLAKIVATPKTKDDVKLLLNLYCLTEKNKINLIAFSMGEMGKISRVACLALGAPFTYTAPSGSRKTAPGQIPIKKMKKIIDIVEA